MNRRITWLEPPHFADEEKTRRARTLHVLQLYMSAAFFIGGGLGVLFIFPEKVVSGLTLVTGLLVLAVTYRLNQRGRVEAAAAVLFTTLWLATTLLVFLSQGMRSLDLLFYISGTVGVGLTLGTTGVSFYVGATILAGLMMAVLGQTNLVVFPNTFSFPPLSGWLLLVMNLVFTVIPLNMTLKILSETLTAARAELAERRQAEANLQSRERILEAVTLAAERFLKSPNWREDIDGVLAQLGLSIHASHAYIFENHVGSGEVLVSSLRHEWAAPGQQSDLDDPLYQNSPMESEGYERFFEVLGQGQILASDRTTMNEEEAEFVHGRGILALLDVPIVVNGRWWGIMGFDDCVQDRVWQPMEMDALKIAANILSAVIERQQADEALRHSEERYRLITSLSSDYTFSTRLGGQDSLQTDWIAGAFEKITGYEVPEFIQQGGWTAVVHPDDLVLDAEAKAQLYQNQRVTSELRIRHKDGTVRWVRTYAHPVWHEQEGRLVGIVGGVQDITQRKRIEEALRASEEKFAKAFQASPDAVTISTLSRPSQFIDVNEGFLRLSGYTREEVLQRPIEELGLWPDPKERDKVGQRLLENGRVHNEEIILHTKAGERRNFLLSAERIEIAGEPYAVFIARDITEPKQMERALRASEDKFAKAFRASPDAMIIASIHSNQGILDMNENFTRLTGYSRAEALNQMTADLNLWSKPKEHQAILDKLRHKESVANKEVVLRHKSGRLIDCLISAELIEVEEDIFAVTIFRDITARKQMEQALQQERLLLRTMIDTLPDYIYLKDNDYRCVLSNVANARALGASSVAEVEGRTLFDFYPAEEAERYNAKDKEILAKGEASLNEENSFVDLESGQQRWTSMSRIPFRGNDGRIIGVVGLSRDITAYKEALIEKERLIAELQMKNAELERFTYTVSHDLKSPLVTITGFLGFLEKDALAGNMDRLHQDIAKIQQAAEQMKRLLQDLLELSRAGRLVNPPTLVPFGVIVRETLNMISIQVAELGIEVTVAPEFPVVHVDRLRLVEVMQNLLENAVKFMGDQPQPRIEIGTRRGAEGSEPIFFVKDNGIGIDPQYHETVFGLFNRLDQSIEGTGIGLALVKRIIEMHGGLIWIESMGKTQGTTFCFTLSNEALT